MLNAGIMSATQLVTRIAKVTVVALLAAPVTAAAQADHRRVDSQRGAELSLFGGAATGPSGTGAAFGWSLGWRPSDRIAIEGSGSWTQEPDLDGFAALIGPRVYLRRGGATVPFITVEAGLFHASVSSSNTGAPDFYRDRMPAAPVERAFNDFVAAGGGGLDIRVRGRLWARPHVRILMVVDGWTTHVLAIPGVHLSYRFTEPSSPP
jgi:hypothetical protein